MKPFLFLPLLIFGFSASAQKRLVVLGDSLTEGYGVTKEQAFPALLQKKILDSGKKWEVINAGISGSTSASGPSRIRWQLKSKVDLFILALGANDGLRGLKTSEMEKNLGETIELAQKSKVPVVLVGMQMPPNFGRDYTQKFSEVYVHLAKKYHLRRIPFLLDKVAGEISLNQTDGIHPNEKGHQIVAETVYQGIKDLL